MFVMNHAYGIKRFILKEEAEMPSVGYSDVVAFMSNQHGENYVPFLSRGKELKVRTPDEIKNLILANNEVKEVMAAMARERTKKLADHFNLMPEEDKIYQNI